MVHKVLLLLHEQFLALAPLYLTHLDKNDILSGMIISYQGVDSVKIQFGDTTVAYNPVSKDSKFKSSKYGADIVLISANHPDLNGVENASRGEKEPFAVTGPGEYEVGGIFIRGFLSKTEYGGEEKVNTIYLMNLENMNLCFLGVLSSLDVIDSETSAALDDIDILFVIKKTDYKKYSWDLEKVKRILPLKLHDVIQTKEDLIKNIKKEN